MLVLTATPSRRWESVSVDFITELPKSHGYDAIMVVVHCLSKHAHFIPTHTTLDAVGTACIFTREVWRHYGLLSNIISDYRAQFVADFT